MVKSNVMEMPKTSPRAVTDAVIQTRGLCKRFGRNPAVDDLSLAVPRGSVFAFLGKNGAGKTTTIRMLLHLLDKSRRRGAHSRAGQRARRAGDQTAHRFRCRRADDVRLDVGG